ncbi:hypothetical protein DLD99_13435 [Pseudomonas kribbensis]|uniref:Class I SAM-dependent methyltransferase n=1 Tax=Pseudomonas kribbensis TaxID=1628086 RepID=A0A345RQ64_9PSED|nr:class I SAM-dependent methyltransferase [Pseudomonas kribbensis]AXI61430.1 hypothetical protein DLD99_13435 [Pseudomonas kribbensis]
MDPRRTDYLEAEALYSEQSLRIGESYVMHEWERPLIRRMVDDLALTHKDEVLEVGFGMGISATMIQQALPARHTIVEPHPTVLQRAREWKSGRLGVQLVPGYWQSLEGTHKRFSAIFFDPFSDDMGSVIEENLGFIKFASQSLLNDGGRLAMFCIHPWLDEQYQQHIFRFYRRVEISPVHVKVRETEDPTLQSEGRMISVILHK